VVAPLELRLVRRLGPVGALHRRRRRDDVDGDAALVHLGQLQRRVDHRGGLARPPRARLGRRERPRPEAGEAPARPRPPPHLRPPNDPDGLLAKLKLPKVIQHDYTGWTQQIRASQWANWKPKGKPPYKVAIVWSAPSNSWNAYVLQLIPKFLKRSPLVDKNII